MALKGLGSMRAVMLFAVSIPVLFAGWVGDARAQFGEWTAYTDARFGYRLGYPQDLFLPPVPGNVPGAMSLATEDGSGKLTTFAGVNEDKLSLIEYRATVLKQYSGYEKVTYGPIAPTWFVLSGFRGDEIYYQKVMFACGGRVVNVFALKYPAREKLRYDPIVTGIAREFRPTFGAACNDAVR